MQKYAGTIITWLICQQAIQERDRELYTYALYNYGTTDNSFRINSDLWRDHW